QEEVARIAYYSSRALRFHRQSEPLHPQKVGEIVKGLLRMLKHRHPDVNVITDFRESRVLEASRDGIEQLIGIILWNAFDAVATGGSVKVRVVERRVNGERGIRVMVEDNENEMSGEVKARLFEPFFSTKQATGMGLGLWIASGIVEDLRGRIRI